MTRAFIALATTVLALLGPAVRAAPLFDIPLLTVPVNLGTVNLGVRAIIGDPVCPANQGPGINARVFAAVRLAEHVDIDATLDTGIVLTHITGAVNAVVKVCLCVQASVANNVVNIPANIDAVARADLGLAAQAYTNANLALGLSLLGANVNLNLAPISSAPCSCPANAIPTCSLGNCGCSTCPIGQVYNPATGDCKACPTGDAFDPAQDKCVCPAGTQLNEAGTACILSPSGLAQNDARKKRSYVKVPVYDKRQTSRENVVKRLQAKTTA